MLLRLCSLCQRQRPEPEPSAETSQPQQRWPLSAVMDANIGSHPPEVTPSIAALRLRRGLAPSVAIEHGLSQVEQLLMLHASACQDHLGRHKVFLSELNEAVCREVGKSPLRADQGSAQRPCVCNIVQTLHQIKTLPLASR